MKSYWKGVSALAVAGALAVGAVGVSGAADGIKAEPIPPGFDYPAPKATIEKWAVTNNVPAMRSHAWNLWAGMTVPSKATFRGQRLPIWETWYSTDEVFSSNALAADAQRSRASRPFVKPRQFTHFLEGPEATSAANDQVVSFNKFDAASAHFLKASHPTPPGSATAYQYTSTVSLTQLNNAWPTSTPIHDRKIIPFPTRGIDTKPVMWLIKAKGLTPVPFWQGPAASTAKNCQPGASTPSGWPTNCHPDPNTWTQCVLVDPAGTGNGGHPPTQADLKAAVANSALACKTYPLVVPRSMFYSFELDAQEAKDFTQQQGLTAQAGDFAALVAMHVTTKEIDNWTWQTYWWNAGKNPPNNYPGSVDGMIAKVRGLWRNYATCTAYSMLAPKDQPVVCFNPFLETSPGIPDGLNSNCMSCHGTARYPGNNDFPGTKNGYPPKYPYVVHGNDPIFSGQTRADFAWAIPVDALPQPGN